MTLSDKLYLAGLIVLFAPALVGALNLFTPLVDRWRKQLCDAQAISWLVVAGLFLVAHMLEP